MPNPSKSPKRQKSRKLSANFIKRLSSWLVLSTALTLGLQRSAKSQTSIFWDPLGNGNVTGIPSGGSGTWDTTDAFWWQGSIGTPGPDSTWPNANTDVAVFGGTAGVVTINNSGMGVIANGLTFNTGGYVINSATPTDVLNLAGTTPTITVTTAGNIDTIGASITGTSGGKHQSEYLWGDDRQSFRHGGNDHRYRRRRGHVRAQHQRKQ
jgi:hypothetical protein